MKDNKLVGEFMGLHFHGANENSTIIDGCEMSLDGLVYDTDWNWLMSVVDKIESMGWRFLIVEDEVDIESHWDNPIDKSFGTYCESGIKIKSTYRAVLEFIKWHNKQ